MTKATPEHPASDPAGPDHPGLQAIHARIIAAAHKAGRDPDSITLIAVSKTQSPDRIEQALRAGHRIFGENYVQEAERKWPAWHEAFPGISLHMIGPLQSNKTNAALRLFDAIHSLDRPSLARRLAGAVQRGATCPRLFVQVNTGHEPQKSGVLPDDVDGFLADCRALDLPIFGLMCIPPEDADPVPHFQTLRNMAESNGLAGLSMGMSSDFESAIAEGATHIRIGSAIFGARDDSKQ